MNRSMAVNETLLPAACLIAAMMMSQSVLAVTPTVIQPADPLDDARGWCVDLFAHLTNALPLG